MANLSYDGEDLIITIRNASERPIYKTSVVVRPDPDWEATVRGYDAEPTPDMEPRWGRIFDVHDAKALDAALAAGGAKSMECPGLAYKERFYRITLIFKTNNGKIWYQKLTENEQTYVDEAYANDELEHAVHIFPDAD